MPWVVPLSLGGTKTVPLCAECHSKVHALVLLYHRELTRTAMRRKKANGQRVGAIPYGYKLDPTTEVVSDRGNPIALVPS
ncbi:MAG TPA: hypothetical protein VN203_05730 [Candidatus Acidoferrum sp.]|nr:hypothetical protein [Candidatus Acidoferrum sp.]